MPQICRVQKLTVKTFKTLHNPYTNTNKPKTRTPQTPIQRLNQQSPRLRTASLYAWLNYNYVRTASVT